jgi:hypothetical protein
VRKAKSPISSESKPQNDGTSSIRTFWYGPEGGFSNIVILDCMGHIISLSAGVTLQ